MDGITIKTKNGVEISVKTATSRETLDLYQGLAKNGSTNSNGNGNGNGNVVKPVKKVSTNGNGVKPVERIETVVNKRIKIKSNGLNSAPDVIKNRILELDKQGNGTSVIANKIVKEFPGYILQESAASYSTFLKDYKKSRIKNLPYEPVRMALNGFLKSQSSGDILQRHEVEAAVQLLVEKFKGTKYEIPSDIELYIEYAKDRRHLNAGGTSNGFHINEFLKDGSVDEISQDDAPLDNGPQDYIVR